MTAAGRAFDRGSRLGERALGAIGREFEVARLGLGASQEHVAAASRISRPRYSKIENGKAQSLQVVEVSRIATVLGLEPSFRLFPAGQPVRDAGHARRLATFLSLAAWPLAVRTEVPLPVSPEHRELRAWDAMFLGRGARTAIELEMRLHDTQALDRRVSLKRRDDPTDRFLLLVADTRTNRRIIAAMPGLFPELRRLKPSEVKAAIKDGEHPPTGLLLV